MMDTNILKRAGLSLAVLAALSLTACATPQPGTPEAKKQSAEDTADAIPDWFLTMPQDDMALYAAGTAQSSDLQLAMDKAVLSAKRALADRINSHVSSKMKEFVAETGTGADTQVTSEIERVTSNLITEVSLSGYSQANAKVITDQGSYRSYVLLKYPMGSANGLLVDQIKKNDVLESRVRASKAFEELEKDIQAARGK